MTTFYAGISNNASSNLCFLNSVIQALASTQEYTKYLKEIHSEKPKGEGSKPSIIEELLSIIEELNTPRPRNTVLRPTKLIEALLANHASSSKLFNSNQQDAHELLMIILEAIDLEFERSTKCRSSSQAGLAALLLPTITNQSRNQRNPFRGLMANRIACAACAFSAGIHHSPTEHLSISLPFCATCTLEDCLKEYTILELLDDYFCRKCTLITTEITLRNQINDTKSSKKRKELFKKIQLIKEAIQFDPDKEFDDMIIEQSLCKVWSSMSTKQTMFARPPRILTVHVSRSTMMGTGGETVMKNPSKLRFPEILILDRFTTTESLSVRAEQPISSADQPQPSVKRTIGYPYKLIALIVHQGNHLSGHYLTFRRIPSSFNTLSAEWLRVSDQEVDRCSVNEALDSNPTLLFYQLLADHPSHS
ncbi:hypothetical protein PSTG_08309 [Puccinia striiformis f. sp. tritici PST-78]|uniref:ubiquitinyl hydrolase 1 n=1 Tax=Puccinia striiformis f. sp. tritici PST-78 TaxID=1165861 RepID=A0A0L0VHB7_9BASI|nr:hypothetical protein PSTG_08309 [Puccinia striiformis f. sp. tritici PST-78]